MMIRLSPVQQGLLDHVLDRALEREPQGVVATEAEAIVQGDAARLLHELTYSEDLLAHEGGLYFPPTMTVKARVLWIGGAALLLGLVACGSTASGLTITPAEVTLDQGAQQLFTVTGDD